MKIVQQPTKKDLEFTEVEKQKVQNLLDWEERSKKKKFILGMPSWHDPENPEHVKLMRK